VFKTGVCGATKQTSDPLVQGEQAADDAGGTVQVGIDVVRCVSAVVHELAPREGPDDVRQQERAGLLWTR